MGSRFATCALEPTWPGRVPGFMTFDGGSMTDSTMLGRDGRAAAAAGRPSSAGPDGSAPPLSAVSWAAVFAGAAGAAALSLVLLILGTGLGLSSVSPFTGQGASAEAFGASTIAWLTFTQLAASGLGGYLAGRLRARWVSTHVDEVYFRDTAHGFLSWAVATLATAAMLTSVIGSIVGVGASATGAIAGGTGSAAVAAAGPAAQTAGRSADAEMGSGYFADKLFRTNASAPAAASSAPGADAASAGSSRPNAEAARIFASALEAGALPADDEQYLAQVVSQRTGLSQPDAQKRVDEDFAQMKAKVDQAREAADKARKASAHASLWLFVSLLLGAFVASFAATFGGRLRDLV
jgi:hypothetical protein